MKNLYVFKAIPSIDEINKNIVVHKTVSQAFRNIFNWKQCIKYVWLLGVILFCSCNKDKESCERLASRKVEAGGGAWV